MGQTPHTLLSLRGYLYSLRGEAPLRPTAYGAAAGRRGEWGGMGLFGLWLCFIVGRAANRHWSQPHHYTAIRNRSLTA